MPIVIHIQQVVRFFTGKDFNKQEGKEKLKQAV
jgi:hypothetical protein